MYWYGLRADGLLGGRVLEVVLQVFQALVLGFRDHAFHPDDRRQLHRDEDEERHGNADPGDHLREEEPDQEVDHPQHEHADAHADPADVHREDFGHRQPGHGADAGLHGGQERHHEQQHQIAAECAFRNQHRDQADGQQRGRRPDQAGDQHRLPADPCHQGHSDDNGDHGGNAVDDVGNQCALVTEA